MPHNDIIKKTKRVVIKIGSGVLTAGDGLRLSFFSTVAKEVAQLKKEGIEVALVSSGAIACGMNQLKLSSRPQNIPQKQAVAAMGQPILMNDYSRAFRKRGLNVAQILLTRDDIDNHGRFLTAKHALKELFSYGAVPIINENDSVAVEEIKVGDNDQLSAQVAHLADADLLVIMTDIDGFHDKDPRLHPGAQRINLVHGVDDDALSRAGGTSSQKSTGGMLTKLLAARKAAEYKIPTWVVNGLDKKILQKIFSGKDVGTLFLPGK